MKTKLNSIEIRVEQSNTSPVLSLLHQVEHALHTLITHNESVSIDLRTLPLSSDQEAQLLDFLGKGEVEARLNAFGESILQETKYAGVWLVEHYNPNAELTGRYLEIAWLPNILSSPLEDVHNALEKLSCHLKDIIP